MSQKTVVVVVVVVVVDVVVDIDSDKHCYLQPRVAAVALQPSVCTPALTQVMNRQHVSNTFVFGSSIVVVVGLMACSFEVKPCNIYEVLQSMWQITTLKMKIVTYLDYMGSWFEHAART